MGLLHVNPLVKYSVILFVQQFQLVRFYRWRFNVKRVHLPTVSMFLIGL